jgi:hypothetical protein
MIKPEKRTGCMLLAVVGLIGAAVGLWGVVWPVLEFILREPRWEAIAIPLGVFVILAAVVYWLFPAPPFEWSPVKPCTQCRAIIPSDARICNECKSFQDWRGYLSVSSTMLALLVALVSVVTTAAPVIVRELTPLRSHVVAGSPVWNITENVSQLSVIVTNVGTLPAALSQGVIDSANVSDSVRIESALVNPADSYLPSGAGKMTTFNLSVYGSPADSIKSAHALEIAEPVEEHRRRDLYTAFLELIVIQSDNEKEIVPVSLSNNDQLSTLLLLHATRCNTEAAPGEDCKSTKDAQADRNAFWVQSHRIPIRLRTPKKSTSRRRR